MLVLVLFALFLMSQPWRLVVLPRNFGHRLRAGAFGRQQIAEGKQKDEKMKKSEGSNPFLVLLGLDVILAKGGSCGKAFLHWEGEQYSTGALLGLERQGAEVVHQVNISRGSFAGCRNPLTKITTQF